MGQKLQKAFAIAKEKGGILLQMRLAMNAGMNSATAATAPDTTDNVEKMEQALAIILRKRVKL